MKRGIAGRLIRLAMAAGAVAVPAAGMARPVMTAEAADLDLSSIFDATFYLGKYPALAAYYGDNAKLLYKHYFLAGAAEGRQPSAAFNPVYYRKNYPDLEAIYGDDWRKYAEHYVLCGKKEGRIADRLAGDASPAVKANSNAATAATVPAQQPTQAGAYSTTKDPAAVQGVIDAASGLTAGRRMIFSSSVPAANTTMRTYYDGSILVVAWKEIVGNKACSFAEVIVRDGSQFRRKFTGDKYRSGLLQVPSVQAAQTGSVLTATADFYSYRSVGTVVYNGQICRFDPGLDTCFITYDGRMVFCYAGQIANAEAMQQFIADNNINFSITFGPIIIDDGVPRAIKGYRLGEINQNYSRASLGLIEDKHYLIMTMNHELGKGVGTLQDEINVMASKGCVKAYALDGGGTGEIVVGGVMYNRPDWNKERAVSDTIYFVSGAQ